MATPDFENPGRVQFHLNAKEIVPRSVGADTIELMLVTPGTLGNYDIRVSIGNKDKLLGITGLKMIEIRGGSSAAELLEPVPLGAYVNHTAQYYLKF